MLPGLEETRGKKPNPMYRGELSKFLHIEMNRMFRIELRKAILNDQRDPTRRRKVSDNVPERTVSAVDPAFNVIGLCPGCGEQSLYLADGLIKCLRLGCNDNWATSRWLGVNEYGVLTTKGHLDATYNQVTLLGEPESILGPQLLTEESEQRLLRSIVEEFH